MESIQAAIHGDARDKDIDSVHDDYHEDLLMDLKSEEISFTNALEMLEKLQQLQSLFESRKVEGEIRKSLSALTETVKQMKIAWRKQKRINNFFH